jgi:FlaG/FlaF family flagellin (archaellin)
MIGPDRTSEETTSARDRAVSDLLAFVLVFGVIITSVGVVYVFGIGALGDAQAAQQDQNAVHAFESMGASFNDLQTNRGQERLSELNPRGARMSIDENSPNLTVYNGSDTTNEIGGSTASGAMHYDNDNTRISYELGAVFRSDSGNSVMIREPEFVCQEGDSNAIVSYVDITRDGPTAIGSESTMQIGAIQDGNELHFQETGHDVTVEISDSDHQDAWERYFEDNGWDVTDGSSVEATCEVGSDNRVVVRSTTIELSLERSQN